MRFVFVVAYFGKWPIWFPAFLQSCRYNPSVDWLIFTDCEIPSQALPNVKFVPVTISLLRERILSSTGVRATIETPYKFCDIKPLYGDVFGAELAGYDFWGHCDIDVIWGDIRKFITEELLESCDIFSTRKGKISGHLNLYRNVKPVNQLYRRHPSLGEIMGNPQHCAFDERDFSKLVALVAESGLLRVHWPEFMINYAKAPNEGPSRLPKFVDKYRWSHGSLFEATTGVEQEILYLHFMNWKKTLTRCDLGYADDPKEFFISYHGISLLRSAQ